MKILIVSSEFPPGPGGIGQHAFSMAKALSGKFKVQVVCNQDYAETELIDSFTASLPSNLEVVKLVNRSAKFSSIKRIGQVLKIVQKLSPSLIIVSGRFPLWIGGLLKILNRKNHVIGIAHGTEVSGEGGMVARITAYFYQKLDKIIAVSNFTAALLDPKTEISKIKIVPNGLDPEVLDIEQDRKDHLEGSPALLTVGNVTQRKGQHRVVGAMPAILEEFPCAHYHMIGLPTNADYIKELALKDGVKNSISVHGRVASRLKLLQSYGKVDIFIMLSENQPNGDVEGFGIAILEANAFGIPAIGAKGSGIDDAISEQSGLLVDGDDPFEITFAIQKILTDYDTYSLGARSWAEQHNWSNLISEIIN